MSEPVLHPHNIIFHQVTPRLLFYDFQRNYTMVFEGVGFTYGNEGRFLRKRSRESARNLLMIEIPDKQYTQHPSWGVRWMTARLRRKGEQINPKWVTRLSRKMGLEAIYPKPRLSRKHPEHKIYPYLLRNLDILDILGTFFWHYKKRPHQSLDDRTPCEVYNFQGAEVQVNT